MFFNKKQEHIEAVVASIFRMLLSNSDAGCPGPCAAKAVRIAREQSLKQVAATLPSQNYVISMF
jgi:hypothetical protein